MDNANVNEGVQQQQQQQRQLLAIEDENEWLRRYGLYGEPHYGDESYANQQEAIERIQAAESYQSSVHAKLFKDEAEATRSAQLEKWSNEIVIITASGGEFVECNLKELATFCDTIYTMAENRLHFEVDKSADGPLSASPISISLEHYTKPAIEYFLVLLQSDQGNAALLNNPEDFDGQFMVDCCRIASYLQCNRLLDSVLVPALARSVDSANCLSMCQLADQLHLPALLEASMNHMMRSLASVEKHEIWGDLPSELRDRILAIQQILQGSNRRQLFFSSFNEYLALFAEQVDYYRERLEGAMSDQVTHSQNSKSWEYAQSKIEKQKERLRILKLVLEEQKKIFCRKSDSSLINFL